MCLKQTVLVNKVQDLNWSLENLRVRVGVPKFQGLRFFF